ncbi:unnamed protein product [Nippostrongylus brasiliensis]|uniref:Hexosyltransferase n=1 Tax=Nippostrongylus brasiliensis TaxID=27835 RepID=A0A158QWW0_NIPBR|nr:unnamed protein product [Nippostrongylus brasiliensis]
MPYSWMRQRQFYVFLVLLVVSLVLLTVLKVFLIANKYDGLLKLAIGVKPEPAGTEKKIGIANVVGPDIPTSYYQHAMMSVGCYARAQGYEFRIFFSSNFTKECPHKDIYLQRHCVVSQVLPNYHILLYIDADMGVVNPKSVDIAFFDRFYNWEVAAGSYIVRNSSWSLRFLKGFADYEYRLPLKFHGTDNGALHAYLAEVMFAKDRKNELAFCFRIYYNARSYDDLFTFEACVRQMFGLFTRFGNIEIYKKGTAWVRDNWMSNSKWSPERDFMIHNWKSIQLRKYKTSDLPLSCVIALKENRLGCMVHQKVNGLFPSTDTFI